MSVSTVSGSGSGSNLYELMALKKQADAADLSGKVVDSRDADGDGKLTTKEINLSTESFTKADTDSDGVLSEEELAAGIESDMQVMQEVMNQFMAGGKTPDFNELQNLMSDSSTERPSAADTSSKIISDYDGDGDGMLSTSELAIDEDAFNQLDSDGDGNVSQEELTSTLTDDGEAAMQLFAQLRSGKNLPDFEALKNLMASSQRPDADEVSASVIANSDTDGDGALSADEVNVSSALFSSLDTDGDGVVSQEELAAAFTNTFAEMDQELASSGQPPPPPSAADSSESVVDDRDTNGDGVLSAEELAVSDKLFGQIDADGDGFVSQDELTAAFASITPNGAPEEELASV